jgi:hypothetical protein
MNNQILYFTSCLIVLIILAVFYNKTKEISSNSIITSFQNALTN